MHSPKRKKKKRSILSYSARRHSERYDLEFRRGDDQVPDGHVVKRKRKPKTGGVRTKSNLPDVSLLARGKANQNSEICIHPVHAEMM